jgi:segregation and condensation protein B
MLKLMEKNQIKRIVEAALLAANQPLSLELLTAIFAEGEPVASDAIGQALAALKDDYTERGVELVEVASGFRFQVQRDVHPWVAKLWTERQTKYTRALLETLALIAYRQPITRGEIEQIRGVAVSANMIRTLEEREWIRVLGHRDVPGKPALFGTTKMFLDYFNLTSLDQLPPLSEIRDLEELTPELDLPEVGALAALEPAAIGDLTLADETEVNAQDSSATNDDAAAQEANA